MDDAESAIWKASGAQKEATTAPNGDGIAVSDLALGREVGAVFVRQTQTRAGAYFGDGLQGVLDLRVNGKEDVREGEVGHGRERGDGAGDGHGGTGSEAERRRPGAGVGCNENWS